MMGSGQLESQIGASPIYGRQVQTYTYCVRSTTAQYPRGMGAQSGSSDQTGQGRAASWAAERRGCVLAADGSPGRATWTTQAKGPDEQGLGLSLRHEVISMLMS